MDVCYIKHEFNYESEVAPKIEPIAEIAWIPNVF